MTYDEWEEYAFGMTTIVPETPLEQSRWMTLYEKVVQDNEGNYWKLTWEQGSTEQQELSFEDCYSEVTQVYPVETTTTVFVTKENK